LTAWAIVPGGNGGSHGLNRTATGGVAYTMDNTTVSNTLPYGNNTATKQFECTTCHDPHDDPGTVAASLGLLRADFEVLCTTCHTARGAGDGTWSGYGAANTTGSHPVGTNVTGDNFEPGRTPIDIGVAVAAGSSDFDQPYTVGTAPNARHELGGHLTEGANNTGVTCTSCHAVHGPNDTPTTGYVVPEDLLVVSQGVQTTTGNQDGFAANGGTGTTVGSPLCSGCHGTTALLAAWNPGGTAFSHPANNTPGVITVDIAQIPAGWPYSSTNGPGTAGSVPNCESCHKPHGATASTPILRASLATICDQCHVSTTQIAGHHPVGAALLTNSNMGDATIGNGDGNLTCNDCHNGSGAHNWPVAGMPGLDPQWLPANNGRGGATGYIGNSGALTPGTDMLVLDNTSRTCFNCHTNAQARFSPTRYTANANAAAYGEYQDAGDGTHWLGRYTLTWTNGELNGSAFNATTGAWRGANGAYSRFGGTGSTTNVELVCESCHTLRIGWSDGFTLTNRATTSLLLYNHYDDLDEAQSEFCQGCHGHDPGVATPHPMTLDNCSKAVDMGRGTVTILSGVTPPAGSYQNAYVAAGNQWLPATANRMNCSSCHQTHDANTAAGTWILEVTPTEVAPPATARTPSGNLYGLTNVNSDGNTTSQTYNPLCMNCHAY
jgi:predicted CXXCH cytochrome family protein